MTSDDTINKDLRAILRLIISDPSYLVIKADQNAPRPKTPYCTVKILASKGVSLEEYSNVDEGLTDSRVTTYAMRNILVSFSFFRGLDTEHDPFYIAGLCRQGFSRNSILEALNISKLGLCKRSQVKNMTFELDSGFEERTSFTSTFNFVDEDKEVINTIGTAEIVGDVDYIDRVEDLIIAVD